MSIAASTPTATADTVRDVARLTALLTLGLAAGAVLAVWVADVAISGGDATLYITYRQATTAAFTAALPPMGGLGLVAAAVSAVLARGRERALMATAALCSTAALLVTVIVHFPINAEILTWSPAAPPPDWQQLRDRWTLAHTARTLLTMIGFALLAIDRWRNRPTTP
jgi:hypothetical protein